MINKVFEDSEVSIYFSGVGSETATISYSSMRYDFFSKGIPALDIMHSYGYDVFGVISKRDNWYPSSSMIAASEILKPLLEPYRCRFGYGSSMGAYGALKHSKLLACDYTLALAPQYSIDPEEVSSWDKRYIDNFDPVLNGGMNIKAEDLYGKILVIADPMYGLDFRHANFIISNGAGMVGLVPAYGCEHLVIQPLASRIVLGDFLKLMIAGDIPGAKKIYRNSRKKSLYYRGVMLIYLAQRYVNRKDYEAAVQCIDASVATYDKHSLVFVTAAKIHAMRGDYMSAFEAAKEAQIRDPRSKWISSLVEKMQQHLDCTKEANLLSL